ncbi:MAG: hypothetical protein WA862_08340 [Solirubrobacterales bacterium]
MSVDVGRFPQQVNRGDESIRYEVGVRNTSPTDSTSEPLSLSISLPQGLTLRATSGSGWTCSLPSLSCQNPTVVPAEGSFPVLVLSIVSIDETAPDTVQMAVSASGAGAVFGASGEDSFSFGPALPFGLSVETKSADESGGDETQAGAHPYEVSGAFEITRRRGSSPEILTPVEFLHSGVTELPAGMVANPEAVNAVCNVPTLVAGECPPAAAVGGVRAFFDFGEASAFDVPGPASPPYDVVYRLRPEKGYPAAFGFKTTGPNFLLRFRLRGDGDYGLSEVMPLVPQGPTLHGLSLTFCGYGARLAPGGNRFDRCAKRSDPDVAAKAFLTLGTQCASGPPSTRFVVDSWTRRATYTAGGLPDLRDPNWVVTDSQSPQPTGCAQLTDEWTGGHEPSLALQAGNREADSPVAYTTRLHVPQDGLEDPEGLATAHLKDATVTFPPGVSLNPAIASGLEACTEEQIGLIGTGFPAPNPIRFDTELPRCPDASKIGTVAIETPLFDFTLGGSVFLAAQGENPFGSDYAVYVAVEAPDQGVVAKLPGRLELDPGTGQVSVAFASAPQLPFEDLELRLFSGSRTALASPVTCGDRRATTELTPWSAADPDRPRADEVARPSAEIAITSGPNGSTCAASPAARPFEPGFSAGARDPVAGARTPFSVRVTRPDGAQELARLELSPPAGFAASRRGIPYCSAAQIDAARTSSGRAERAAPSCPAASQVGTTEAAAGAGPSPFRVSGKLYLAGRYKGAPLSVVAITPAVAGPFDLGTIVIRSSFTIDPLTARIGAVTDPMPQIVNGIPLRLRDLRLDLDRPGWTSNPTSCEPASVLGHASGSSGAAAALSQRFQVGDCNALGFRPKLSLRLFGAPPRRGGHPRLRAVLRTREGDANIGRVAVILPGTEHLDNSHIRAVCTRARFEARACPAKSIYGYAKAWSPLLDRPLRGPVYLRSSDGRLPDVVASLDGQIRIDLVGKVDATRGRIRIVLPSVPDVPVSRFELTMEGARKGLLVNNTRLCRAKRRANVLLRGHNGKARRARPVVKVGCGVS